MTRDEWLSSDDPAAMLAFVTTRSAHVGHPGAPFASDRKLGLFGSHLLRLMCGGKDAFADGAEAFADGASDRHALRRAWRGILADDGSAAPEDPAEWAAGLLRDTGGGSWLAGEAAGLLREIVGDPFIPHPPLHHHALGSRPWVTPTALSIARAAYDGRDFGRLPILADALEEAGCPAEHKTQCPSCDGMKGYNEVGPNTFWQTCRRCDGLGYVLTADAILTHLRGPGPHVRGCWCLDLVLGLS